MMNPIAPPLVRVVAAMPKHFKASDERHIAQYWRARERIRNQWFRGFSRMCKKQFKAEATAICAALEGDGLDDPEAAIDKAIDVKAWTKLYKGLYVGVAQDIAPMILQQYQGSTGKSYRPAGTKDNDLWMTYMLRYIDKVTPAKITGLTSYTRDRILDTIARGSAADDSIIDIVGRVNSLYSDSITPLRSMTIARTEVTAASNAATQQTGEYVSEQYELDIIKKWITARDKDVRDSHQDMEGIEVDLDELFDVNGSSMLHPGDTSNGADMAEIVNCRCDVVQSVRDT